ncbi:MAG: hypothetical protein GXP02_03555 [Alphaproteobacteria bacterium]|nr:hypothetical protein [Alphaproteobacteria bacterium]
MPFLNNQHKALIIAVVISGILIVTITNLSYATPQRSVLEFDQPSATCALSICSLL